MGDVVNLASRIEGLTKLYRTRFLMCGITASRVEGSIATRKVDAVRVKGKTVATELFDAVDDEALRAGYAAAFALYQRGDFAAAAKQWKSLGERYPSDGPTSVMAERAAAFATSPPPHWDGIYTVGVK